MSQAASGGVLVLCYHVIGDLADDPVLADFSVSRREFERQIDDLLARGFTFVTPCQMEDFLSGSGRIPLRGVLLTFDDCYGELVDVAREVLAPRNIPAVAFAVAGLTAGTNEWDQPQGARRLRLLDAEGLLQLQRHGVEIGCHSMSHVKLTGLPPDRLAVETAGAAEALDAIGVRRPRFYAYPFGDYDDASRSAVRASGFAAGFAVECQAATPASDRFALPRIAILAGHTGWRFWLKTAFPRLSVKFEGSLGAKLRRRLATIWRPFRRFTPEH